MPYDVEKSSDGGYIVKKKGTGKVVARPKDKKGLKGFLYHSQKGEGVVYKIDRLLGEVSDPRQDPKEYWEQKLKKALGKAREAKSNAAIKKWNKAAQEARMYLSGRLGNGG